MSANKTPDQAIACDDKEADDGGPFLRGSEGRWIFGRRKPKRFINVVRQGSYGESDTDTLSFLSHIKIPQ